jgi:hypothetical protein
MARYNPDELPEYNEALMCPDCQEKSDVIIGLYGLFGGGIGPYTMCADCGKIVSKSCESHEQNPIIDAEFSEVKDGERGTIEKDKDRSTE